MFLAFEIATIAASIIIFLLTVILFVEVMGCYLPVRRLPEGDHQPGPIAVIIPAHNEASSIEQTLKSVLAQSRSMDRVIVVADNCTDETAQVAEKAGADCLVRIDTENRGKGYALQFALDHLKGDPPETVVFVDADCTLNKGALLALATTAERKLRPVQALYLMKAPLGANARLRVGEFAWAFLNNVRMTGLDRLFGVSRITGAGIALPWKTASTLNVGSGEIVEDLAMTLSLTAQKQPPYLLRDAIVTSEFPTNEDALTKQRARWEHGSQRLAVRQAFPCFFKGVFTGNIGLSAIALDLLVPPIINLFGLILAAFFVSIVAWFMGASIAFGFALGAMLLFGVSVIAGWLKVGRESLPVSSLMGLLPFFLAKTRIYGDEGRASAKQWTATRSGETDRNAGD